MHIAFAKTYLAQLHLIKKELAEASGAKMRYQACDEQKQQKNNARKLTQDL